MGYEYDDYFDNPFSGVDPDQPPEKEEAPRPEAIQASDRPNVRSRADEILDAAGGVVRRKIKPICDVCKGEDFHRRSVMGGMQLLVCKKCNHKIPWASQPSIIPPADLPTQIPHGAFAGPPKERPDRFSPTFKNKSRKLNS